MTVNPETRLNPYVGPRAFQRGETLYGRDREVMNLLGLLIAERIVLLYSPSGAGKTSLIQARLIPELEQEDFHVLPVMRVGLEPPPLPNYPTTQAPNRYVLSLLLSLEETLPPEQQTDLAELVGMTLPDYLDRWPAAAETEQAQVLILDQFEEILTVDPTDRAAKEEFFTQLGAALRDRYRWALFAMREDYLAGLDPYLRPIPTQFSTTYRLELLGRNAALDAIEKPARQAGVGFDPAASDKLANDLRRVRVQRPDGTTEEQLGPYVEPVQLQVVCHRLWENLPPGATQIGAADVEAVGDVDTALSGYYAERVAAIAGETGVHERAIREWFDQHLITEQGIRGQVLQGSEQSEGLDNRAIWPLVDAHLVRAEKRRGATWFELAHDRLVEPVRADNAAWREAHLSALQRQAALWESEGRPDGFLLRQEPLAEAETWASTYADEMTNVESVFLEECQKARTIAEREQQQNRRIRWFAIGAAFMAIVAIVLAILAWRQTQTADTERQRAEAAVTVEAQARQDAQVAATAEAEARQEAETAALAEAEARQDAEAAASAEAKARRIALSRQLAAEALAGLDLRPQQSLLLALEAVSITQKIEDAHIPEAEESLRQILAATGGIPLRGHDSSVEVVAFSPDGHWLATGSNDNTVRLWSVDAPETEPVVLREHEGTVNVMTFSSDGTWLATGSNDNTVRLWNTSALNDEPAILRGHQGAINAVAFSPSGYLLATGSDDQTARLWNVSAPNDEPVVLSMHEDAVEAVSFSPDGHWLATGSRDTTARLWDISALLDNGASDSEIPSIVLSGHADTVQAVAFSPDKSWLATGSWDTTVRLWRMSDPEIDPVVLYGHSSRVVALDFSPNGRWLATGGWSYTPRIWDMNNLEATSIVLRGHKFAAPALAFSPDGNWLATGSDDNTARLWNAKHLPDLPDEPIVLRGHERSVAAVTFSPDGSWLATAGSWDYTARLWNITNLESEPVTFHGLSASAITFSPDGHWLAVAGLWSDVAWLWDVTKSEDSPVVLRGHDSSLTDITFSPSGQWLATGSKDKTVHLWNVSAISVDTTAPVSETVILSGHKDEVEAVAFSPDGRWLATGSQDGTIRLWDFTAFLDTDVLESVSATLILTDHKDTVDAVAFSPDGHWLASGSWDGTVRLWDVSVLGLDVAAPVTASIILRDHEAVVRAIAFSPDGHWLATGSDDKTSRLWDVSSLLDAGVTSLTTRTFVLRGHEEAVKSVAFSSDSHWLATAGSWDRSARLWDLDNLESRPIVLRGYDYVEAVAFSPKTEWLATASRDTTVRLWSMNVDKLIELACSIAGRNLSQVEWEQYLPNEPYHPTCPNLPVPENMAFP